MNAISGTSQWLRLGDPSAGAGGSIWGQGTRAYMTQPTVCMLQLRFGAVK